MLKKRLLILFFGICLIGFQSCKNDNKENSSNAQEVSAEDLKKESIHLTLTANDQMQFDTKELVVGEGQEVTLTLKHTGKMSKTTMGHNFVLLDNGISASRFAQRAVQAKDNDYIPESDKIIAHTDLIGGGETTEITFKAPEKGTYEFLCTFPGHYASMHGKFIVK